MVGDSPSGLRALSRQATSAKLAVSQVSKAARAGYQIEAVHVLVNFIVVILIGGALFSWLEKSSEVSARATLADFVARANGSLARREYDELLSVLGVSEESLQSHAPHNWDFVGACFFCFTAATTIGYGNYTPTTSAGKLLLVFYAVIAIPACLKAYIGISDAMLELVVGTIARRKERKDAAGMSQVEVAFQMFDADRSGKLEHGEVVRALAQLGYDVEHHVEAAQRFEAHLRAVGQGGGDGDPNQLELDIEDFRALLKAISPDAEAKVERTITKGNAVLLAAALFLVIVLVSTLIFGATRRAEGWSYLDAFYFTVVTFTTIGFGDFSPDPHPGWFGATFIVVCFFGLGVTATLVRAASDPEFSVASTLRGLMPHTWDACRLRVIQGRRRVRRLTMRQQAPLMRYLERRSSEGGPPATDLAGC